MCFMCHGDYCDFMDVPASLISGMLVMPFVVQITHRLGWYDYYSE